VIELEEAQARLFALADPVSAEAVSLEAAFGRWAAAPVTAIRTQPAADLSAMDGYAMRFADLPGPWRIIGESAAGGRFVGNIETGQAVRIFTGAVLPAGADTVIVQEDVEAEAETLRLTGDGPAALGAHIRQKGGDFESGEAVIAPGTWIGAAQIALAIMAGQAALMVGRRVRVAIISTGDELVAPGTPTADDQIPSSNAPMLAALLADLPVDIVNSSHVRDNLVALTDHLKALPACDVVVTLGGASVGDHDLVRPALIAAGAEIDFWKIAMRPGKPVMAGRLGDAIALGLPGNPVSAYVTAILLLLPLIRHLSGAEAPLPQTTTATLGESLPANGPRRDHLRARLHNGIATRVGDNDSSMLLALASANALIIRSPNANPSNAGDLVDCIPLP
jgi:molybdopterin molybdotransferase